MVRQRLLAHATAPTCVGCHKMMDPIGLSLENFDSVGTYRAAKMTRRSMPVVRSTA